MADLLLNTTTHDLDFTNYNLSLIDEMDELIQQVKIRLLFFSEEWFLDTTVGLPFYTEIFVKNPNIDNINSIIKTEILNTPNVLNLTAYESEFDSENRRLNITFSINTLFGETTINQEL